MRNWIRLWKQMWNLSAQMAQGFAAVEQKLNKIMADESAVISAISDLLTKVTALLAATDPNEIANLKAQIAQDVKDNQALNALVPQIAQVAAAVASATPAPVVTPPAGNPQGAPFDASLTYVAGDTATDADGNLWTAVSPVVGEAPGVTAGNWLETTVAAPPVATA